MKKEEEKSHALYFLVAVSLLIITAIWVIWWETKTLRPWKDYQKKYHQLVVAQLEKELEQSNAEFLSDSAQKEYNDFKSALEKAKVEFESPAAQTEYKKAGKELGNVSGELKRARHNFQKLRSSYLKTEYDYIKHSNAKDKLTLDELNKEIAQFDKGVPIYIDSNLGGAVKGEDISKDLHERGFTNLYLATGYSHKRFPRLPWLQDIVGKEVPWQIAQ